MTLRPRSSAPTYIDLKLRSRAPMSGTLVVEGRSSGEEVFRQEIPDLTLLTGGTTQRLLLPPPFYARAIEEVHLRFVSKSGNYDLGSFSMMGEDFASRHYVIGMCRPQFGGGESQNFTWRALRPDREIKDARSRVLQVVTSPVWFAPEDMPSGMGLCSLDLVVLEGPALAALSEKQLADLAIWVEAGGSVCVVAARDLKAEHQTFLDRLSISDEAAAAAKGHAFLLRRVGLGRAARMEAAPSENELTTEPWIAAAYHLAHADRSYHPVEENNRYAWNDRVIISELEQQMLQALPRTARLLPLPVLGGILAAFVLLIGPGEWILLGKLRLRRWTWVTFPLIAAGCAFVTVRAAEHYLGTEDQHLSLVVTDFSPQGKALRENRFDLWFTGRNKDVAAEKRQALSVSCSQGGNYNYSRQGRPMKSPVYEGRVPSHYTLRQPVFQWTPYVQRTLSFAPASSTMPALQWAALQELPPGLGSRKSKKEGPSPSAFVSGKIGAQDWDIKVYHSRLPRSDQPGALERLTLASSASWMFARSPSGEAGMLDMALDHDIGDLIVVAWRRGRQEIQIQRCVYHFDSHE